MVWTLQVSAVLELLVVLFQVFGVLAFCVSKLHTGARWAERGRVGVVIALVGLGVAGTLCGRHHSEFSLFAGLTMGLMLVFICIGGGHAEHADSGHFRVEAEPIR
jgi:hypothetical protein